MSSACRYRTSAVLNLPHWAWRPASWCRDLATIGWSGSTAVSRSSRALCNAGNACGIKLYYSMWIQHMHSLLHLQLSHTVEFVCHLHYLWSIVTDSGVCLLFTLPVIHCHWQWSLFVIYSTCDPLSLTVEFTCYLLYLWPIVTDSGVPLLCTLPVTHCHWQWR